MLWHTLDNLQTFLPLPPNGLRGHSHLEACRVYGINPMSRILCVLML
jgi:hypothetical protein